MLLSGKNFISRVVSVVFVMGLFAVTPLTQGQEADEADEPLSFEEAMVVIAASAGDREDLRERLGDMSREEIGTLIEKICLTRSEPERSWLLSTILNAAIALQPLDELNSFARDMMAVVVQNTGGDTESAKAAMKGLVGGSYNHPDLDDDMSSDDITDVIGGVAENSASGAIDTAEQQPDLEPSDIENVAGAVADGGYEAISEGSTPDDRMEPVADAMVRGGVVAASEPNRPGVALAMLRMTGNIPDDELRKRAAGGAAAGGGDAGGEEVGNVLQDELPDVLKGAPEQEVAGPEGGNDPVGEGVSGGMELPQGAINPVQHEDRSPR